MSKTGIDVDDPMEYNARANVHWPEHDFHDEYDHHGILEIMGISLTSLALHADDLDDACIESAIRSCPQLDNLVIDSASVTLRHVIDAYEQGVGGQPSSLDLRNVSISREMIDGFLERLGREGHPLHRTVRRLAIGKGLSKQLGPSTAERLDAMLANNRVLSHLYVQAGTGLPWHPDNHGHNRKPIIGTPFPRASRYALVSVLHHLAMSGQPTAASQLQPRVLKHAFEFASDVSYRVAFRAFGFEQEDEDDWGF